MKKIYPYLIIVSLILVLALGYIYNIKYQKSNIKNDIISEISTTNTAILENKPESDKVENNQKNTIDIPQSYTIENVPFQSQAPFANWDELHDEACEEASIIIANYFLQNKNLSAQIMEDEILKLISWEIQYFGSHKDLTAEETVEMAQKYFSINAKSEVVASISDIKSQVSQNHLVIIPTAGRLLGNPNFRSPGPVYHMLVISGYDGNKIITQDVGTRKGQNYIYNEKVLFNAIHDWSGSSETINAGQKVMIIIQ